MGGALDMLYSVPSSRAASDEQRNAQGWYTRPERYGCMTCCTILAKLTLRACHNVRLVRKVSPHGGTTPSCLGVQHC
jgi:hypothetical protein